MKYLAKSTLAAAVILASQAGFAFKEYPAGEPVEMNNMEIAAVYLQPIEMEPRGMAMTASQADIHLEADIHATEGNQNGFGAGEWMPYLKVDYKLVNKDNGETQEGTFMPMVASDGPHYGNNIKMMGPGNYELTYTIEPPIANGLYRHTDEDTGVAQFWKPFDVTFNFEYAGIE